EKEAVKNYLPLAITAAIKEYVTIELDLGASAQELKCKEVTNIKYKVRGPMKVHLVGNSNLKLDISQSVLYLKEQGYQVEIYSVEFKSVKIVFPGVNAGEQEYEVLLYVVHVMRM
ncbi:7093_t:CDS:2, partial [Rhizophagus irregularis]